MLIVDDSLDFHFIQWVALTFQTAGHRVKQIQFSFTFLLVLIKLSNFIKCLTATI